MSQFFDIDFQLFSHFRYEKSKFLDQVKTLRARLTQPDHPNYLWNPSYVTDVPADGFDIYAKNIWNVVKVLSNTVVCDSILRKIISSYFLTSVSTADL